MFSRLSVAFVYAFLAFTILATAKPWNAPTTPAPVTTTVTVTAPPTTTTITSSQCTTGPVQCCNSVQAANSVAASTLLGLLGVVVQDVTALVGITCTPITVIGVGGNSCNAQTVCCENNSFKGIIAIGCTPVNIAL